MCATGSASADCSTLRDVLEAVAHRGGEPSEIDSKCPLLLTTLVELTNPHEEAPRFESNSNDRLHADAGISCQLVIELKLLVTGSVEMQSAESWLA
jgi:hypothetical protein